MAEPFPIDVGPYASPPGGKTATAHKTFCGYNYSENLFAKEYRLVKKLAINFAGFYHNYIQKIVLFNYIQKIVLFEKYHRK